ncbi:DUF551 domain-containing protein [Pandoraea commovens]|uniref:Uncharacterized protein n=1 Tax=Pandoraea commovens TaxID=2508289 RepID=A0A5E4XBY6_9BURK|nr:DUF551 domain-containing protein [Pandoraea commovens]VVE33864.1 hypothetical protein PCO31010_03812 [Pandoraea commovens]
MNSLLQLWYEVCERAPASLIDGKKYLNIIAADVMLLGVEIERACLPPAPKSVVETLESGWHPIETAPRDGTDLLLTNRAVISVGHWLHQDAYIREHRDFDGRWIGQDESDGFDDWIDWSGGMNPKPTHWMPLPAAPIDEVTHAEARQD